MKASDEAAAADGSPAPSDDPIAAGLAALRRGEAGALDRLVPLLYDDLRRAAHQRLRSERDGHTLDTTALAHEAYLRMSAQRHMHPADRSEFFAAASNTMRRILVDYARSRRRHKRGDGVTPVPIDQDVAPLLSERAVDETLALDGALDKLEAALPRAARVFEQRLFGGLSIEEVSDAMGVSTKTIQRDWDMARAWLRKEVGHHLTLPGLP